MALPAANASAHCYRRTCQDLDCDFFLECSRAHPYRGWRQRPYISMTMSPEACNVMTRDGTVGKY